MVTEDGCLLVVVLLIDRDVKFDFTKVSLIFRNDSEKTSIFEVAKFSVA